MLSIAATVLKNFRYRVGQNDLRVRKAKRSRKCYPIFWEVELLEDRSMLSGTAIIVDASQHVELEVQPFITAGDPNGTPSDTPEARVDPNTTTSPYAGVGSIFIETKSFGYICTGTVIENNHVGTAAHCLDVNGNGDANEVVRVRFVLNYGGNLTHVIDASSWIIHPEWTGFLKPAVNDDVAVLTLNQNVPAGVPIYDLFTGDPTGQSGTLVGYGTTGDPVNGYISNSASFDVKRVGENTMGVVGDFAPLGIEAQDDVGGANVKEVWVGDFDHWDATASTADVLGDGLSLGNGNKKETTLGGGDSGGPFFLEIAGKLEWAGINTFGTTDAPAFGSLLGGMSVSAYADWITDQIVDPPPNDDPPTVGITSPSNNDKVSGTVTIVAAASDDIGVASVEFFVDGASIGMGTGDGSGNWTIDWDSTTVEDGKHNLTATAEDSIGQKTESSSIKVNSKNGSGGGGGGGGGKGPGGGGPPGRNTVSIDGSSFGPTAAESTTLFPVFVQAAENKIESLVVAEIRDNEPNSALAVELFESDELFSDVDLSGLSSGLLGISGFESAEEVTLDSIVETFLDELMNRYRLLFQ